MQHQSVLAAHSEAHADAASALFVSRADCADPVLLLRAADNSVAALPSDVRTGDGWGRVSKGVLTVLSVSGQHHGLLRALAVQAMAPALAHGITALPSTVGDQPSSDRAPARDRTA